MLERWVASVFTTYLGRYIKNLDKHGLQVSMWNGEVVLHDLELSPEALIDLDLPVIIDRGVIGQLRIEIPWKNFYTKTCKIEVTDVQIAVLPIKSTPWNEGLERKKRQMRKKHQLIVFESGRREKDVDPVAAEDPASQSEESDSFGARIARHIISTLEVSLKRVVLRYEDACTDPRRPVAWTIKFDELSVVPDPEKRCAADSDDPNASRPSSGRQYRLGTLEGLSFSIDHLPVAPRLTGPSKVGNTAKWCEVMSASAAVSSQLCTPEPVGVTIHVSSQPSAILDLTVPKNTVEAQVRSLHIRLKRWQYDSINRTARYVADFRTLDKFRQFRPQATPRENAKEWWTFAFRCVQLVGRDTRTRTRICWDRLKRRNANKGRYIELYKRTQSARWHRANTPDETKELEELEEMLEVEAIIYFRRTAYFQLRVERAERADREEEPKKPEAAAGGVWGWLGWSGASEVQGAEEEDKETKAMWELLSSEHLTREQRKILHEELGVHDEGPAADAANQDIPLSYVQTHIRVSIQSSLVQMCENSDPPKSASSMLDCLSLEYDKAQSKELGRMAATDLVTMSTADLTGFGISDTVALHNYRCVFGLAAPAAVAPSTAFASVQLTGLTCQYSQMASSWKIVTGLKDIDLASTALSGSQYSSLLRRVSRSSNLLLAEITETSHPAKAHTTSSSSTTAPPGSSSSSSSAHFAPKTTTYSVFVHLSPMDCVVDVVWLQTVCAFWGVGVYGSCAELEVLGEGDEDATTATASPDSANPGAATPQQGPKKPTPPRPAEENPLTALKMSLERQSELQVSVLLEQPCLIVPSNCQEIDSVALVVLAETVTVQSNPGPSSGREARIREASAQLTNGSGGTVRVTDPSEVPVLRQADYYTHYIVKSEYGRILATTTRDWLEIASMESSREYIVDQCLTSGAQGGTASSFATTFASNLGATSTTLQLGKQPAVAPLVTETGVEITAGVSLVPKIAALPRMELAGGLPSFKMTLNRAKVVTLERALTNIQDFAGNVTGRGRVGVIRPESEDLSDLSCSTFAQVLGPMETSEMDWGATHSKRYVELDASVAHLRVYEEERASRIATLIDLSTREFSVEEPHNALIVNINSKESLWLQLPSSSMHQRWLKTLNQIKLCGAAGSGGTPGTASQQPPPPPPAGAPAEVPQQQRQEWVSLDISLGDLKIAFEEGELGESAGDAPSGAPSTPSASSPLDASLGGASVSGDCLATRPAASEWTLMNCRVALTVTGHDSRFEILATSLVAVDCKTGQQAVPAGGASPGGATLGELGSASATWMTLPSFTLLNLPTTEQRQILWSNEGDPGFSFWLLTFLPSSVYFDPRKPTEALMQMGVYAKNLGVILSPALCESLEMFWDVINIFMSMAGNTRYFTARNGSGATLDHPPELPRPFDHKQNMRFSFEVEGEMELACLRPNSDAFVNISGEDFFLQFFDTPYGFALDGHLYKPAIEDQTPFGGGTVPPTSAGGREAGSEGSGDPDASMLLRETTDAVLSSLAENSRGEKAKKWSKFLTHVDESSRLNFEYIALSNRGALKGDVTPERPTFYNGVSFTHQLKMNIIHCEVAYFQTFFWSLLEYLGAGLCSRLAFLSWRPVFTEEHVRNGEATFVAPYDTHDPSKAPEQPYLDLMKFLIEITDCTLNLPPSRESELGVLKGNVKDIGVSNELEKTDSGEVLLHTVVAINGFKMEAPMEMWDELATPFLFRDPVEMNLITTNAMVDPCLRHPTTKITLEMPRHSVMYLTENVYCAFLFWMTNSLMEPYQAYHVPTPPGPPAYVKRIEKKRMCNFAYDFLFESLELTWLKKTVPAYTLYTSMSMGLRWFTNTDFENDVDIRSLLLRTGVAPAAAPHPTASGDAGDDTTPNLSQTFSPSKDKAVVLRLGDTGSLKTDISWVTPDDRDADIAAEEAMLLSDTQGGDPTSPKPTTSEACAEVEGKKEPRRREQTLKYTLDTDLFLKLDPAALIDLTDSLMGHRACRSGGYIMLGYVKPESGWPAPGEAFPAFPPQTQIVRHIVDMESVTVTIPDAAVMRMSLHLAYRLHPDLESAVELQIPSLSMFDAAKTEVVSTEPGDTALSLSVFRDGKGPAFAEMLTQVTHEEAAAAVATPPPWGRVVSRIGQVKVVATVGCFAALHTWSSGSDYQLLVNLWAATPQHRIDSLQEFRNKSKRGGAPTPAPPPPAAAQQQQQLAGKASPATPGPPSPPTASLPVLDLMWCSPKLSVLCMNNKRIGFVVDFGTLHVRSSRGATSPLHSLGAAVAASAAEEESGGGAAAAGGLPLGEGELVVGELEGFAVQSVCTEGYVLAPLKAEIAVRRQGLQLTGGRGAVVRQVGVVHTEEIVSYLDFYDVRTIAAVAYDYSAALTAAPGVKRQEAMSSAAARKAATRMEAESSSSSAHHAKQLQHDAGGEGGCVDTTVFSLSVPLLSFVFSSGEAVRGGGVGGPGGKAAEQHPHGSSRELVVGEVSQDLPLPSLKEPDVDSTISLTGIVAKYSADSDGGTSSEATLEKFSVVSASVGNLIQVDLLAMKHAAGEAPGCVESQELEVTSNEIKVLVVPQIYFGMMNFVYLPYAAATMPDTYASQDVLEVENDFDLHSDMVLNRDKMLHISGKYKNFIKLTGNLHELHLIGDRPLIRLDAGVTLMVVSTKLYLYNKELTDYVDAEDGAYVFAPANRNEIDKGVPPIPAWSVRESGNQVRTNRMKVSTRFDLSVHIPEGQDRPARGVGLQCSAGGTYQSQTVSRGEAVLESTEDASFSIRNFSIRPRTAGGVATRLGLGGSRSQQKKPMKPTSGLNASLNASVKSHSSSLGNSTRMLPGEVFDDPEPVGPEAAHILEPVDEISIRVESGDTELHTGEFHFRLSSEDTALLMRAANSLEASLAVIRTQAKLKIERADEDLIQDAIVKAQQEVSFAPGLSKGGGDAEGGGAVKTASAKFGTIDVLVVEDSSGFDIPLFFVQLKYLEAKSQTCRDFQSHHLEKALFHIDYYNLESCEWQNMVSRPIQVQGRHSVTGPHKKELSINISWVNLLITPQVIKTLADAQKFGAAFGDPSGSGSPKKRDKEKLIREAKAKQSASGGGGSGAASGSADADASKTSTQFRMYEVTNQTGYSLDVYYQADGSLSKLPNRSKVDFNFGEKYGKEVMHYVPIAIEGEERQVIDVGRVGTTDFKLFKNGQAVKLFCAVELTAIGRKKVFLSSSVTLVNDTPVPVELRLTSGDLMAHPSERVSIPHADLNTSFMSIMPKDLAKGFLYTPSLLGLHYGSFHKLYKEVFVLRSTPILPEATITALEKNAAALPPNFTCFCQISTDLSMGNTTVTLFPVFSLQNLTGLPFKYNLVCQDAVHSKDKRNVIKRIFKNSKKGDDLESVASGEVATDGMVHFTQADPSAAMFLDLRVVQPTGECMERDVKKHPMPFCVRNPAKNHQGRVSNIVLSDANGRSLYLQLEFSARMVKVSCPLWIINQTTFYLELALHNPMKSDSSAAPLSAGQCPGDGIKPGRQPFLIAPENPEKDIVGHLYCRILVGGSQPQWSSKIDISNVGSVGTIECPERTAALPKTIAFSVEFPWGHVETRTRVVRFTPRWIVINRTVKPLYIRHEVKGAGVPGKPRPFSGFVVHSQDAHQEYEGGLSDNLIAVKLHAADPEKTKDALFCKPFLIDKMGETDVNLKYFVPSKDHTEWRRQQSSIMTYTTGGTQQPASNLFGELAGDVNDNTVTAGQFVEEFDVIRVAIFRKASIVYVTVDSLVRPPYLIENRTDFSILVKQLVDKPDKSSSSSTGASSSATGKVKDKKAALRFAPLTTKAFTWESPERSKVMDIRIEVDGKEVGTALLVNLDPKNKQSREATMQELKLGDKTIYLRVRHRQSTTRVSLTMDCEIDKWFSSAPIQYSHKLCVSGVSVMLQQTLQNVVTEVAHLSLHDLRVIRRREEKKVVYSVKVQQIQLDDQRAKADFPVVLCNKIPRSFDPFISVTIERLIERSSAAVHIQNGRATSQPLDVRLHDRFLYQVLLFSRTAMGKIIDSDRQVAKKYYTSPAVDTQFAKGDGGQDGFSTRPLFLEKFTIDAVKLNATLVRSSQDRDKDFFRQMLGYLAVFVRGFEDNLLVWPQVQIDKHCDRAWLVATMLKDKYLSETTGQLLRVAPGVATVRNVVTDLLKTLPSSKDEPALQYQTPRKRVQEPAGAVSGAMLGVTTSKETVTTPGVAPFNPSRVVPIPQVSSPVALPLSGSNSTIGGSVGASTPPRSAPRALPPGVVPLGSQSSIPVPLSSPPNLISTASPMGLSAAGSVQSTTVADKADRESVVSNTSSCKEVHLVPLAEPHSSGSLRGGVGANENYFDARMDETTTVPFHESNSAMMTKTRQVAVLALKKKSWERFHPSGGRTTWEEFAQACTWDEFRKHTTDTEFKRYAHLAVDHYIRLNLAEPSFKVERQLCRCTEVGSLLAGAGSRGLQPPTCAESRSIGLNWYEFAHHTSWDEFRGKTTDEEFHRYAHFARDCLLGTTEQFRKLDVKQELVAMFQM